MSKNSDIAAFTDEQTDRVWTALEPLVQAAITRRLHQFHDALEARGQLIPTSPEVDCVVAESPILEDLGEHTACSAEADTAGSSPPPLRAVRLH